MTREINEEDFLQAMLTGVETPTLQARITALCRRKNELMRENEELKRAYDGKLADLEKTHRKTLEDALTAHRAEASEEIALAAIGLADPLGRRLTREKWATMDPKTRPSTPAEYHRLLVEQARAHAEDATKPAPELDPWQRGYITVPTPDARPKVVSAVGGSDRPAGWTDDQIKTVLGIAARK